MLRNSTELFFVIILRNFCRHLIRTNISLDLSRRLPLTSTAQKMKKQSLTIITKRSILDVAAVLDPLLVVLLLLSTCISYPILVLKNNNQRIPLLKLDTTLFGYHIYLD